MSGQPGWTYDVHASKLHLWIGSHLADDYRDVTLVGPTADLVCEALSFLFLAQRAHQDWAQDHPAEPETETPGPDRAALHDWALRARLLADEIQDAAEDATR